MPDVQEVFRMATQKVRPDPGALDRQHRDQRWRVAKKKIAVYAMVAAVLIAGTVIGINSFGGSDGRPGGSDQSPSPSPTTSPTPISSLPSGPLDPGTYVLSAAPGGTFDFSHRITIGVPSGYEGVFGWMVLGPNTSVNFGIVDNVFADPCRWGGTLLDPPVGPRVDDLVAALANLPGHATAPADVTLNGYAGRQIELTTPTGFVDCEEGEIRTWTFAPGEDDYRSVEPGQHNQLWILDVDGVRLVLDVSYTPDATAQDRAELLQIVESIRIEPR
jgi:hypothetical protein